METITNTFFPLNPLKKISIPKMLAVEEGKKFKRDELSCEMVVRATGYSSVNFFLL